MTDTWEGWFEALEGGTRLTCTEAILRLLSLSEALEFPVSTLLGETVSEPEADTVKAIAEKLEVLNWQLAREKALRRSTCIGGWFPYTWSPWRFLRP